MSLSELSALSCAAAERGVTSVSLHLTGHDASSAAVAFDTRRNLYVCSKLYEPEETGSATDAAATLKRWLGDWWIGHYLVRDVERQMTVGSYKPRHLVCTRDESAMCKRHEDRVWTIDEVAASLPVQFREDLGFDWSSL